MKDYEQVMRDVCRKRDKYLERRKKRIAYIEKGVSIMSITGILVVLGLCTSMSSSIAPVPQNEPQKIDIKSGICTVAVQTLKTSQTSKLLQISQSSTAVLSSTSFTDASTDVTSKTSSAVTADTTTSAAAVSSAVRNVLTSAVSSAEETETSAVSETGATLTSAAASTTESTQETTDTTDVSTTEQNTTTESIENETVISCTYEEDANEDETNTENKTVPNYVAPTVVVNEEIELTFAIREKETLSDTVYIDSEELRNGDYVFQASLNIETDDSLSEMWHLHTKWDTYTEDNVITPYIKTENLYNYRKKWNDDKTNLIIDAIDAGEKNYYTNIITGDPYSAGPYKIYIDDIETGERNFYDLTYDEETGIATAVVPAQQYTWKKEWTLNLTHYDPDTPYGELLYDETNAIDMHCFSGYNKWISEKRDSYYELGGFDVVIDQNTPEGVYFIRFTKSKGDNQYSSYCNNNYMSGNGLSVFPTNLYSAINDDGEFYDHNDPDYWLKIVVGDSAETEEKAVYDVNQDGTVGVDDAAEVLRIYAETAAEADAAVQIQQAANINADVDGDGEITLADATAILQKYAETASGM